tara:strand:+ start:257 stop:505 length:249 start_codon:yes stop_codon:yes gene_type:complete
MEHSNEMVQGLLKVNYNSLDLLATKFVDYCDDIIFEIQRNETLIAEMTDIAEHCQVEELMAVNKSLEKTLEEIHLIINKSIQ